MALLHHVQQISPTGRINGRAGCLNQATLVPTDQTPQQCAGGLHGGLNSGSIPNVRCPTIRMWACQKSSYCNLLLGENVDVVEECENLLVGFQSFLHGHESKMLSNSEEQGHQRIPSAPLLRPFVLGCTSDTAAHASIALPKNSQSACTDHINDPRRDVTPSKETRRHGKERWCLWKIQTRDTDVLKSCQTDRLLPLFLQNANWDRKSLHPTQTACGVESLGSPRVVLGSASEEPSML